MQAQMEVDDEHEQDPTAEKSADKDPGKEPTSVAAARLAASRLLQPRIFPRSGWLNPNCLE